MPFAGEDTTPEFAINWRVHHARGLGGRPDAIEAYIGTLFDYESPKWTDASMADISDWRFRLVLTNVYIHGTSIVLIRVVRYLRPTEVQKTAQPQMSIDRSHCILDSRRV